MAMQMNSVVHVSTSPSLSPATSPPPEGKQEHGEVAAVHVLGVGDDEAVMVVKDEEAFGGGGGGGVDYSGRAQWLRAAVLGANDGLVSVASLMIGVGAVNESARTMLVSGIAGLVAGACSMAIGEFVSVYAQYDIEVAAARRRRRRQQRRRRGDGDGDGEEEEERRLPSPFKAAAASALAFTVGALLPLLAGGFVRPWAPRVAAVCAATSAALAGFGALGAALGGASPARSAARVLLGGWAAMAACYGVLRLFANLY
uniref:Vacuolar iron transporter n=1 Tax=Oryza meridionalis TaxID=40149 RepID=A0A0E0EHZ2_9ORYZ